MSVDAQPYNFPYAGGALDASDTALILIDMQVDFCGHGGYVDQMGYDISATRAPIEPLKRVLAAARRAGVRVRTSSSRASRRRSASSRRSARPTTAASTASSSRTRRSPTSRPSSKRRSTWSSPRAASSAGPRRPATSPRRSPRPRKKKGDHYRPWNLVRISRRDRTPHQATSE